MTQTFPGENSTHSFIYQSYSCHVTLLLEEFEFRGHIELFCYVSLENFKWILSKGLDVFTIFLGGFIFLI